MRAVAILLGAGGVLLAAGIAEVSFAIRAEFSYERNLATCSTVPWCGGPGAPVGSFLWLGLPLTLIGAGLLTWGIVRARRERRERLRMLEARPSSTLSRERALRSTRQGGRDAPPLPAVPPPAVWDARPASTLGPGACDPRATPVGESDSPGSSSGPGSQASVVEPSRAGRWPARYMLPRPEAGRWSDGRGQGPGLRDDGRADPGGGSRHVRRRDGVLLLRRLPEGVRGPSSVPVGRDAPGRAASSGGPRRSFARPAIVLGAPGSAVVRWRDRPII